jgi:putative ABC transport system permease protein
VTSSGFIQDCRFAARMLVKHRSFTLTAVLTLGVGIGANVALFSVVDATLLRPLPYGKPDQLVRIWEKRAHLPKGRVSWADYADWKAQNSVFSAMAAYQSGDRNLTGNADPEQVQGASVSANLFSLLRVSPQFGRSFLPDDEKPGAHRVVILSHSLWERRFGSDSGLLGKSIRIDEAPFDVVGIMPADFFFPDRKVELWVPLAIDPSSRMAGRTMHILDVIGRLRPEVGIEKARANMGTVSAGLEKAYPRDNTGHSADAGLLQDDWTSSYRTSLILIFGAVTFVLMIACANVATLLLSRATERRREVAIRCALGAGRRQIIRQLFIESLLLSLVSAAAGLLLAHWLIKAIILVTPADVTRIGESGLTLSTLAFALLVALGAGILFGLAPALHLSSQAMAGALKENARSSTASRSANRLRNVFVVAEVALSAVLLTGAGLLVKSFFLVEHINPGFNVSNVLTANVNLQNANYRPSQRQAFLAHVLDRIRTDPTVLAAGAVTHLPLAGNGPSFDFQVAGRPPAAPGEESKAQIRCATPDYFRALGIPLLGGRAITERDSAGAPNVIVINDVMAGRYWPNESPIGKQISFDETRDEEPVWREIVGVVQGVRHSGLEYEPEPQMYAPFSQFSMPFATLVVHTRGNPLSFSKVLRRAVTAADASEPVSGIRSMEQVLEQSIASRRFSALMLGFFSALALLVASIGVYGVLSYAVSQRRAEVGIRLALGASVRAVMWQVMKQGMSLAICGVCLGAVGSWAATRLLSALLYKVSVTDPSIFGSIAVLLLGIAMLASYLPARRAADVDPVLALRSD